MRRGGLLALEAAAAWRLRPLGQRLVLEAQRALDRRFSVWCVGHGGR
jgi:hypothetical protein